MATMIPDVPIINSGNAEARLYDGLRQLPDEYRIYHSVAYCLTGRGPAREGELDFLVLHPERGLLGIEVKGGRIAYDGRSYSWTSTDRAGKEHRITDPFRQAQDGVKDLVREIERRKPWGDKVEPYVHGHAVAFPDCEYTPPQEPINAPRELVIDSRDLGDRLEGRIAQILGHWTRPGSLPLTRRRIKQLGQQVLAPHFRLGISLGTTLSWEERGLALLDEEQSICLEFLDLNGRATVEGGAGTGKTLIACESVRRLASAGADVLLLCFNLPLSHQLKTICNSWGGIAGTIRAGSFHDLCREWAGRAGLKWEPPVSNSQQQPEAFWNVEANRLLLEASQRITDRFDALVVDESQDFPTDWWPTLQGLLRDPEHARLVLFSDPSQDLWSREGRAPWPLPRFPLRTNQRNTREIARFVQGLGTLPTRDSARAPEGKPPEIVRYGSSDEEQAEADRIVTHLLHEGLSVDRIAIIGTRRLENSFLAASRTLAGHPVQAINDAGEPSSPGALRYATPGRFKGLEADVVLLCDVDGEGPRCSNRSLYVAASRARHRLYVLAREGFSFGGLGDLSPRPDLK